MKKLLLATVALAALPTATFASEADGHEVSAIIVTGKAIGYKAVNSVTATKTNTPCWTFRSRSRW
uniref:Uncharacterized protein n=1 Tax=Phenylobacterium glaciei TaxID=2803784 RepID=A0A974P1Q5_9CAUL|nr:hypothetical protein JKL49_22630 [Phenylobacterium glaciei]